MAVLQVERFHVCAMKRDRKRIMEFLQLKGVVELKDVVVDNDEVFSRDDTSSARALFDRNADIAQKAADAVQKVAPQKKGLLDSFKGRTPITVAENDAFNEKRETVLRTAHQVLQWDREITDRKAEIARADAQQEALQPWMDLPIPQNMTGTKKTAVFVGSVEGQHDTAAVLTQIARVNPELEPIHVDVVSASPVQTCFYAVVLRRDAADAEEALRAIGFTRPPSPTHRIPRDKVERLEKQKKEAEEAICKAEEEIAACGDEQDELHMLHDNMKMRSEKYSAIEQLAQTKHTIVLDGYIPSVCAPALIEELKQKFDCDADVSPVGPTETPPTILHNNKFSRPAESVLESYSLPHKGEIDPTVIMSIFYYVMFGMMFSDAGYGAIVVLISGIALLKFKHMEKGMKQFLSLFFWCGISTVFWGVMFGSYFGDLFDVVAQTFFGRPESAGAVVRPLWMDPLANPMSLLMFCLLIGVIHITVGFIIKGAQCVKDGKPVDLIFETVFPVGLAYALILILMTTTIFEGLAGFLLTLPSGLVTALWVIAAVCAVGVILTAGRESKNPGIRVMKGLYGLYNTVAGWISDVLSYSRLLALGLATGVIASVMNALGSMFGSGFVKVIVFVLIFIVGQLLNFFINALGAYVHSNRLEFVEFFGKFYEGDGRKFMPLGIHTKYYKIEEETQHV